MNKKEFFPNAKINFNKLELAPNSSYSITKPKDAKIIEKYVNEVGKNLVIFDGTANVGGDSINFGLNPNVKKVYANEINPETFKKLVNNVKVYGLEDKVECFNLDTVELIKDCLFEVDILFLDAPWGGRDYKKEKYLDLEMGKYKLYEVIKFATKCKNIKNIFLKVPYNYQIHDLLEVVVEGMKIHKIYTHKKYYLLITFSK